MWEWREVQANWAVEDLGDRGQWMQDCSYIERLPPGHNPTACEESGFLASQASHTEVRLSKPRFSEGGRYDPPAFQP